MKLTIAFLALLLVVSSGSAMAQTVAYDSLAIDTLITGSGTLNPDNVRGNPDTKQAQLSSSSVLAVQFAVSHQIVTMKKGSVLHFYWIRETSDSNGAYIQFMHYDYSGAPRFGPTILLMESGPLQLEHETILTVPDTGFNALQITIAADTGASSCYVDAIMLIQPGTAAVAGESVPRQAVLTSYPNPFARSSRTTVHIDARAAGRGILSIIDALGREIVQLPLGELREGGQEVSLALGSPGIFFARLFLDGSPQGAPLKITAE